MSSLGRPNIVNDLQAILLELNEQRTLASTYTTYQEIILKDAITLLILLKSTAGNHEQKTCATQALEEVRLALKTLPDSPHPRAIVQAYNAIEEFLSTYYH